LLRRIKIAIEEHKEQAWAFEQLTSVLPPEVVKEWTQAVELWEDDSRNINPFVVTVQSKALSAVLSVVIR
jgi:hypothetical protein